MIAVMHGQTNQWLRGDMTLLATKRDVPFAVEVAVCVCHGYTWVRSGVGQTITVVKWED